MKLLATACACVALGAAVPASAQSLLVGGAYGQTARLVIAAGDPIPTESGCAATGRILTRLLLPAAERSFDLRPGQADFVEVNLNALAGSPRRRVELLPAVTVLGGRCRASLEIFDNATGRTAASVPVLLLPASGASLPPVGPALGQIVRVGVIRGFDPQPDPPAPACTGVVAFTDARGNLVAPARAIDLRAGGSAVIDLDAGLLLPASGETHRLRRFVQPKLLLPASGGGDISGCTVSVQLVDRLTGFTTLAIGAR